MDTADPDDEDANKLLARGIAAWLKEDYPGAEDLLVRARDLSSQSVDTGRRADCLKNLGIVYQRTGRFLLAEQSFKSSRMIYERLGLQKEFADCMKNLGIVYRRTGRFLEAEAAHTRAAEIYGELGLAKQVADCDLNIGIVYRRTDRPDDAEAAYLRARHTYATLDYRGCPEFRGTSVAAR